MLRFTHFEASGVRVAAITEAGDGDFVRPLAPDSDRWRALGLPSGVRSLQSVGQIHGVGVVEAKAEAGGHVPLGDADAIVTDLPHVALAIRVADCVPIYLFDPTVPCAALVHAGRKGTCEDIAAHAVRALQNQYSASPDTVRAHLGPSAGPCCYEVDGATAKLCHERGLSVLGRHVDLWTSNERMLVRAGLDPRHISRDGTCTICSDRFHSFRRTGASARNLAILCL